MRNLTEYVKTLQTCRRFTCSHIQRKKKCCQNKTFLHFWNGSDSSDIFVVSVVGVGAVPKMWDVEAHLGTIPKFEQDADVRKL